MKKILLLILALVALATIVYFVSQKDRSSAAPLTTKDFVLEDTASVGRVVISDPDGKTIAVSRGADGVWMVNEKYRARLDAINLILKTLHLLEIKHPVGAKSRENVLRMMAGRHKYVKVYDREGDFLKAYYVGMQTKDERGTYMVLEQPDKGRTEIPYVMTMKAFYGFLTSRFFTNEQDWRDRFIIRYPELDINRVAVTNHLYPQRSFAIGYGGGNDLHMFDLPENTPVPRFDTSRVKDYLLLYKRAGCETYELAFEQQQIDSVLKLPPSFEIEVTANEPERSTHLRLFLRPAPPGQLEDDNVTQAEYDREIMYGTLDGEELFRVQRYVFDAFLPPKQAFTGELDF